MMICTAECSLPRTVRGAGTDSQFISHQTLHRPDNLIATTTRPVPDRKPSRLALNPATGNLVCDDF